MEFELLTLAGSKYSGTISEVALKTGLGQMAILPHHEPFTGIVLPGSIEIHPETSEKSEIFVIFGGLVEVNNNHVRVMADEAEHLDELVQEEIEAALKYAQELKAGATHKHDIHRAQTMIDRHEIRLGVVRLHRHHRPRS